MKRVYNIARRLDEQSGSAWEQHWFFCQYSRTILDFLRPAKHEVKIGLNPKAHYDINERVNTVKDAKGLAIRLITFTSRTYTIELKDGTDLDRWLRENLTGRAIVSLAYENTVDTQTYTHVKFSADLLVKFTRPNDALMFKLVHA